MNVEGVHPAWAPKPIEPAGQVSPQVPAAAVRDVSDVVEISTAAALAAKIQQIPDIRADLVARVKQEIEAGTYETPERIDIAVDRLMEDMFPELL
ncbi:MAG: flagellar biosynthesis anti-sigma factor FlgM [Planctomycetes bacterium]|nr:flagellar biosynthesis anti-sigma factor FlgM [Planctomycetota bacterium]